ncbi:hypothetical protein JCM8547_005388 [Rhodosporidiobolus lusitaniae]
MVTHNQAGIDFDQHPPRTADGRDANRIYTNDRGVVHNPRESDEHKKLALDEMHKFEEAERRTAEGYEGTILNPARPDAVKLTAAEKLATLPHWHEETKKERREVQEYMREGNVREGGQQQQQGQGRDDEEDVTVTPAV